ncbi:MAG: hypothetical protein GY898_10690, partial [Proteobacteria bacterium]|nr:hypothetical protein [Pseudomonadota bacterium]
DTVVSVNNLSCAQSGEHTAITADDCNDNDPAIKPGASEIAGDEVDQNCDGDELCYDDTDNDNYVENGSDTVVSSNSISCQQSGEHTAITAADCNDTVAAINPGATEIPGDEVDQNCDDDELCYDDTDNDNYVENGSDTVLSSNSISCQQSGEHTAITADDCNDTVAAINPGATEIAGDEVDQNCDDDELCYDDTDNDDFVENGSDTVLSVNSISCQESGEHTAITADDCNDNNAAIKPGASEIAGDEVDQNCDGDELCYDDTDNDNFVENGSDTVLSPSSISCQQSGEHTSTTTADCDDTDDTICPTCSEVLDDDIDQDCDDRDDITCYDDGDGDDYGLTSQPSTQTSTVDLPATQLCPGARHTQSGDCNDSFVEVFPGVQLDSVTGDTDPACTDTDDDGVCIGGGRDNNDDGDCEDSGEDIDALTSGFRADCDENVDTDESKVNYADNDADNLIDEECFAGNEVMVTEYYSDSAGTEPDWFEIQNMTWFDVDIRSWVIGDGVTTEAIPNSTTILSTGGRAVICHGASATLTCDRTLNTLALEDPTNGSMTTAITLTTAAVTVDTMDANTVFNATATAGTSMQLDNDELDDEFVPGGNEPNNDINTQWCEATATSDTWSGGVASPGTSNEDCP